MRRTTRFWWIAVLTVAWIALGADGSLAQLAAPPVPGSVPVPAPAPAASPAPAPAVSSSVAPVQSPSAVAPRMVTVEPERTDAILANPGMGWQTFHRTAKQDKNLPDWIPSTVHYARWGWGELEPEPGRLAEEFLDGVLRQSRESGQQLAFRVMCASTTRGQPYHPAWLARVGGKEITCRYAGEGPLVVPDLDDPTVLQRHLDFIRRLGRRYDGHPDLDHVDLGSVGWWGEWHMSSSDAKMPSPATQRRIVETYLESFRKTPLLMLIGGGEMLTLATSRGAGWRADCLGDLGGFSKNWCHMRKGYPFWIRQAGVETAWQTAPVAWETCWDMRKWVAEGWSLRLIFNYALALHGSYINNKSAPLPDGPEIRPEVERFLRRLGYRLELAELRHPAEAALGGELALAMKWRNTGSAPCYRPYRIAVRLTDSAGNRHYVLLRAAVDRFLPGSIELFTDEFFRQVADLPPGEVVAVAESIRLPDDLALGECRLAIGVVAAENPERPVVRLGIAGRDADGWYPLSRFELRRSCRSYRER